MKTLEYKRSWEKGEIDKKTYWTGMREDCTSVLPQLQKLLMESEDCDSISITRDACILEKKNGLRVFFDFSQTICRAEADLIMGRDAEKEDMDYVIRYLQEHDGSVMLDIGANVGLFSLEICQTEKDLTCHVFEPIPRTFEMLKKTAELNGADPSWYHVYNIGMSDETGTVDFYLPAASEAASLQPVNDEFYLRESDENGEYTGKNSMQRVECLVDTVDHFVNENHINRISFVKIDVEGNEKAVLTGAQETLKKYRPLVYCELLRKHAKRFGYHPNDVIALMKALGYECRTIIGKEMTDVKEISENTEETNFFFFPIKKDQG